MRIGRFADPSRHDTLDGLLNQSNCAERDGIASARADNIFNHDARAGA